MKPLALQNPSPAARHHTLSAVDRQVVPIALMVVAATLLLGLAHPRFAQAGNLYAILLDLSLQTLAVSGFVYVMATGEIDLSAGAVYGFTGAFAGFLMQMDLSFGAAALLSLGCALLFGVVNGLLTVKLRLNSLMLTIGTMVLIRGLSGVLNTLLVGETFSSQFRQLARLQVGGVHLIVIVALAMLVVFSVLERRTAMFRRLYLAGESAATAVLYGLRVDRIKIAAFACSALAAGAAGLVAASRVTHADAQLGDGLEFTLVTAAVLGGASLAGGKGTLAGASWGWPSCRSWSTAWWPSMSSPRCSRWWWASC
ncbi:ABC transporter permease [Variovorax sp. E3]|uniref:ABC transporter permease n=1 Tax=Variovorax sp. E3 TaxID=1914993 RepID=UPI0018DB0DA9|nr:ABC transporter permease [Variovorax sp. E3]